MERLDIAGAAARLGLTPEAVRKRIKRGALQAEKRDGRWYVVLPTVLPESPERPTTLDNEPTQRLVQALQDQIRHLETELERKDVLLAELIRRLPELPAPEASTPRPRPWWHFWRAA